MKVCIVGAGNIGLVFASVVSLSGEHEVVVFTKREIDFSKFEFCDTENSKAVTGLNIVCCADPAEAFSNADYVFCTYPAFLRKTFLEENAPYFNAGTKIGFVPGYGGAEYMAADLIKKGVIVFGLQRVPFVARKEGDTKALLLSRKQELFVASIPRKYESEICRDIELLLGIPTTAMKEYLAVTLAPSNPLLHLTGLYGVLHNCEPDVAFDRQLMFYEEWNDDTSEVLFAYDAELQEICNRLPFDLSEVVSLPIYYESPTPEAMTEKLKSIKAFEVVQVPLKNIDGKYYVDYQSRMFVEDFPYGIAIIKYFALLAGVETPTINKILAFYTRLTGIEYFDKEGNPGKDIGQSGVPSLFGLYTLDDIEQFYS